MFELRTGVGTGEKLTLARVADEMGCSVFRVQKLLNKYTPKLLEKDASNHREIEIGKLDLLEEKLWTMVDEDYYTVSNGQVVYLDTGDPVPDRGSPASPLQLVDEPAGSEQIGASTRRDAACAETAMDAR